MSGGSWRQSCELTDRNVIEGRDLWDELAQHNEILWFKGRGKWRSCAAKVHVLIRGDLPKGRSRDYGSLTEGHFERDGQPTEPYGSQAARRVETLGVIGQKSAEVILAKRLP